MTSPAGNYTPAFRDLIKDPAVVNEFDYLSAQLKRITQGFEPGAAEKSLDTGLLINTRPGDDGKIDAGVNVALKAMGITIDGGGAVITTGVKGCIWIPSGCTIQAWTLLSTDPAFLTGSIVIDIWKCAYADYPPTDQQSICAAALPTIDNDIKGQDETLIEKDWTVAIPAGSCLAYSVISVTTLQRVTLVLKTIL